MRSVVLSYLIAIACVVCVTTALQRASADMAPQDGPKAVVPEQSAWAAGLSPVEIATRIAAPLLKSDKASESYIADLPLIAMLALDEAAGLKDHLAGVRKMVSHRKFPSGYTMDSYEMQLFCSLPYELIKLGQGSHHIAPFIAESRRYKANVLRAHDGAVSYYLDAFANVRTKTGTLRLDPKTAPLLIDHAQEYVSRMAKTGWLSEEQGFYSEAAQQIQILRNALRDPESGLWSHGRGWYGPADNLVTTKWGRAHAWLLHGLVETLIHLPRYTNEWQQVSEVLQELAAALLKFQDEDGFWHQVIDRPDTFQETSATAFISYDFARAVTQGLLPDRPFRAASIKAFKGVTKLKVSADGAVYGGSATLPPLPSTEEYVSWETPVNDLHAVAAVIFSAVGQVLLDP